MMPTDVAAAQYGVTNIINGANGVVCAAWWGGYQRLQPGSYSGTKEIETFHGKDLKGTFETPDGKSIRAADPPTFLRG